MMKNWNKTDPAALAIALSWVEMSLPNWYWRIGVCNVSGDFSCGPNPDGPDADLRTDEDLVDDGIVDGTDSLVESILDGVEDVLEIRSFVLADRGIVRPLTKGIPLNHNALTAAIAAFETTLPGWLWSVGSFDGRTRMFYCAPDRTGPDADLSRQNPGSKFETGFTFEHEGSALDALNMVVAEALAARNKARGL